MSHYNIVFFKIDTNRHLLITIIKTLTCTVNRMYIVLLTMTDIDARSSTLVARDSILS